MSCLFSVWFGADYSIRPGWYNFADMKASTLASRPDARTAAAAGSSARWEGLTRDDLLRAYRTMLLSRRLDDKEIQLKNQSLIFFQISGAGHEAVLTAAGMHLRAGYDWFYPYYRDRALCLTLGMTPLEMLLARRRREGRSEFRRPPDAVALGTQRKLNIPSQGSPTGTQCLHAVGAGEAGMIYERVTGDRRSRGALPRRRDHLPVDRRRRDQRRRVLGIAEHRLHAHRCRCSTSSKTTATRSRCRSKCRRRAATSRGWSSRSRT